MILSFLFFTFLFYVLFKLVFGFVLPIYRTTRKVKQSFREMNRNMNGTRPDGNDRSSQNGNPEKKKEPLGDYIDFEEVKE